MQGGALGIERQSTLLLFLNHQARDQRGPAFPLISRREPLTPAFNSSFLPKSQSRSDKRFRYARMLARRLRPIRPNVQPLVRPDGRWTAPDRRRRRPHAHREETNPTASPQWLRFREPARSKLRPCRRARGLGPSGFRGALPGPIRSGKAAAGSTLSAREGLRLHTSIVRDRALSSIRRPYRRSRRGVKI